MLNSPDVSFLFLPLHHICCSYDHPPHIRWQWCAITLRNPSWDLMFACVVFIPPKFVSSDPPLLPSATPRPPTQAKLLVTMWTCELADTLKGVRGALTVNALSPCPVNTALLLKGWGRIGRDVGTTGDVCWAAVDANLDSVSGALFVNCHRRAAPAVAQPKPHDLAAKATRKAVWDALVTMTGAVWDVSETGKKKPRPLPCARPKMGMLGKFVTQAATER